MGDRLDTYRELEHALQVEDGCLPSGVVNCLIAEASGDLRAAQGVMGDVKMAASDFLVALACTHFYFVMTELQSHLKVVGKAPDEAVLVTLGKMAGSYALHCVPFVGTKLLALRRTLSQAGSGRTLHTICGVAAVVGVLVCEERYCQRAQEQLLRLLRQHQRVQDSSQVTKVPDVTEVPGLVHKAKPSRPMMLQAPAARKKLPQVVAAMQVVCTDPSVQVWGAVLEFIRELLSSDSQSCWPWDVVGHIFNEYSRSLGRLLLWPRLLQYVVPAQCSGVLILLSRCLRTLLERAGCKEEEEPNAVDSQEQGRAESSLDSAEWEQHVLKLFLYKALWTALAGCWDLSHVQGQMLRFLQDTDSVELSETQGVISVVSHAADTHFNLVLDTVTTFTRDRFYETSTGWKAQPPQGTERPQATRAALMCVYGHIALRAPREKLLARMDREIMGTILWLSRVTQRDWIKEEPGDSLVYGVFQALEELREDALAGSWAPW
ncbi:hypothetical protein AV530_007016 [Patagioenas fasciata monilis]|uniref:Maestro heat-like repeat-containing protein family member 2B n=1 Tax=Patagioenas fasciata monilis TaxID=372326 RepID=A0A1V4JES8_PATFA|nr:hypothetical protein AV530_007016 [Patagioenas fasciata monilis]